MEARFSSISLVVLTVAVAGFLVLGIKVGAHRAQLSERHRRACLVLAASLLIGWLVATATLAVSGALAVWTAIPPRVLVLLVSYLATLLLLSRHRSYQQVLSALPVWSLIALQTYRIGVETVLWLFHQDGQVPIQMTFEGRNVDMLVGITAPAMALAVQRRWVGKVAMVVWNVLGMGILVNTIATAATSVPGPVQIAWPGEPFLAIATWPLVWIPAFLAPTALFLHIVSIGQTLSSQPNATR